MVIHIANTFDQNRLGQYYALLASIFDSNQVEHFCFHVVESGISDQDRAALEKYIESNGSDIVFYNVDHSQLVGLPLGSKWTTAVYYRLLLLQAVPSHVHRILYLDTDIVVVSSLVEFVNLDLKERVLAAVYDNFVGTSPDLGIVEEGKYFNSGVMLIDLVAWRKDNVSDKAINFLTKYPEKIKYVDQDALNAVLRDSWLRVDEKYNFIHSYIPEDASGNWYKTKLEHLVIIHFTMHRPWMAICKNRYRSVYRYYFRLAAFNGRAVVDYDVRKVKALLELMLVERYIDSPQFVKDAWRKIKNLF